MNKQIELSRMEKIRSNLERGDRKKIAELIGVTDVWVRQVFLGNGTSEPVLQAAEQLISEREQLCQNGLPN